MITMNFREEIEQLLEPADKETSEQVVEVNGSELFASFDAPDELENLTDENMSQAEFQEFIVTEAERHLNSVQSFYQNAKETARLNPDVAEAISHMYDMATIEIGSLKSPIEMPELEADGSMDTESVEVAMEAAMLETAKNLAKTGVAVLARLIKAAIDALKGIFSRQQRLSNSIDKANSMKSQVKGNPVKDEISTKGFASIFLDGKVDTTSPKVAANVLNDMKVFQGLIEEAAQAISKYNGDGKVNDCNATLLDVFNKYLAAVKNLKGFTVKKENNNIMATEMVAGGYQFQLSGDTAMSKVAMADVDGNKTINFAFVRGHMQTPASIKAPSKQQGDACLATAGQLAKFFKGAESMADSAGKAANDYQAALKASKGNGKGEKGASFEAHKAGHAQFAALCSDLYPLVSVLQTVYVPFNNWLYEQARGHLASAVACYKNLGEKPAPKGEQQSGEPKGKEEKPEGEEQSAKPKDEEAPKDEQTATPKDEEKPEGEEQTATPKDEEAPKDDEEKTE